MRLLVVSAAPVIPSNEGWQAYGPYIKEMGIWAKYADSVQFCCPTWETDRGLLVTDIPFKMEPPVVLRDFDIQSAPQIFKSFFSVIVNMWRIALAMKNADHIHLRCPGNIGLLGALVQILFPSKPKTAKYAGNWDSKAKQPWSYRLQKRILSNTFLTKNMQVLVYGEWEGSTKNIKPFFTASYFEKDKKIISPRDCSGEIRFVFIGTLSKGKQPLYAVRLVEALKKSGHNVRLDLYGEGTERSALEKYIEKNKISDTVNLRGNQMASIVQQAFQDSHFLLLPSQSEGWPKVVAEAMFWGCVPVASAVSCVPNMLDKGNRGIIMTMVFEEDKAQLEKLIANATLYRSMSEKGIAWSRNFTLDYFEDEIAKLLRNKS